MSETIIGREAEKKILRNILGSGEAELVAILGRRRIGKTFLILNYFEKELLFEFAGVHDKSATIQLSNFSAALQMAMKLSVPIAPPNNWHDAFIILSRFLEENLNGEPKVILFDEFPWIHTPKSGFLSAFAHWWNTWASRKSSLKVIICGSAASWMIRNVLYDRGGLHNRVSQTIRLYPFNLKETQQYLISRGIILDPMQLLKIYMALGGIPHYLKKIEIGQSSNQIIDHLFFEKDGALRKEFEVLYQSLFNNAGKHEAIVKELAKKQIGMSRSELISKLNFTTGGTTSQIFDELEESGFITYYLPFGKANRDGIYKLTDEYSIFYLRFVQGRRATGKETWHKIAESQAYVSWCGFAFEAICQKHVAQIKQALGISGIHTEESTWRYVAKHGETGAQIDLLVDRNDHCINVCEIKFSKNEFTIDKDYAGEIDRKIQIFKDQTGTKKTIFPTMMTTFGTKQNINYTGRITSEVVMEDLFK